MGNSLAGSPMGLCSRCDKDGSVSAEVRVEEFEAGGFKRHGQTAGLESQEDFTAGRKLDAGNADSDAKIGFGAPGAAASSAAASSEAQASGAQASLSVEEAGIAGAAAAVESQPSRPESSPMTAAGTEVSREQERVMTLRANEEMMQQSLRATRVNSNQLFSSSESGPANRYAQAVSWPTFVRGQHVPVIALLNPLSGAGAGRDILKVAHKTEYYNERFFSILDVVKGQQMGGMLDVFRVELNKAKDEAKAMGCRPRLISGGGDGTASFALTIIFMALRSNEHNDLLGFKDSGNGFVWSDEELAESFPAFAQMPLGSANDCAHILGWGQKYPGSTQPPHCCLSRAGSANQLSRWILATITRDTPVCNFDVWGILPKPGQQAVDFRLAELAGPRGRCPNKRLNGKRQIALKQAGKPVPFFVCLYFSAGFGAYMTARFQLNRRRSPLQNRLEYVRQALGIFVESIPPQLMPKLDGVQIDCEDKAYFPPRRDKGQRGRKYREVGFYNINWQANALHGADRAKLSKRLCGRRPPVKFDDGLIDMFRWNVKSVFKNPGLRIQTDKRKDMCLRFDGSKGKGVFFQWDGESRFAFSPTGDAFHIYCRQVMRIPVLLGPGVSPSLIGDVVRNEGVRFSFVGDSPEAVQEVRSRIVQMVAGDLDMEMLASEEDRQAFACA
eukprot:TRINITY_DN64256_c0_g1_i1.p1 TRINITY_DN64256_c0_g1~~TRINITY_DN64256_c0_g1_i1.p1  ORF type:complete len:692 (-),score=144.04 TRINITY_DN64256_c0_g1_i1:53-2065(-)